MKKTILFALTLFISNNINATEQEPTDSFLWKQQENYISNMINLENSLNKINEKLTECRINYYKDKTEQEKNTFLKETKEFSTGLLVTKTILAQSIQKLESKMKNDKEGVIKNLREYSDVISESLESENQRNKNILKKYSNDFNFIKSNYCILLN